MTNITAGKTGVELPTLEEEIKVSSGEKTEEPPRERWSSEMAYIITAIGSAVGLGNLVRFPGLCQKFGAGAFFVPYFLAFFVIAIPFLILECGLGQHFQGGWVVGLGRIHPRLRAMGVPIAGWMTLFFYAPLITYIARMMFASVLDNGEGGLIWDEPEYNYSLSGAWGWVDQEIIHSSADFPKLFDWSTWGANIFVWVLIWAYAFFGVRISGYISYVTVTLPVVMILVMLGAAATMDGVGHEIYMYVGKWDFSILLSQPDIWALATAQIMLSASICLGFLSAFASYNDKKSNIARTSVIIATGNSAYSVIGGFTIFVGLGHLVYRNANGLVMQQEVSNQQDASLNKDTNTNLVTFPQDGVQMYIDMNSTWAEAKYNFGFTPFFDEVKRNVTDPVTNSTSQVSMQAFSPYKYQHWFSQEFAPQCYGKKTAEACPTDTACRWIESSADDKLDPKKSKIPQAFCGDASKIQKAPGDLFTYVKPVALGLALCFGTYPIVLGSLPAPHFWNFLFFFTLLLLGLDSGYALMEGMTSFMLDTKFLRQYGRKKVHTVNCILMFLLTSTLCGDNGLVLLDTLSEYVNFLLLFLGMVEAIAVGWIYRYGKTSSKCGSYANQMLTAAYFFPIFFGSIIGFGIASQADSKVEGEEELRGQGFAAPLGFGLTLLLQAIMFPIFFYVASIDGNPKFTYKERLWDLFFGNVEHLRNEFNAGCLGDDYDEALLFTGIPKYYWTVCIKYISPAVLYILCLIVLTKKKICKGNACMGHKEGTIVNDFGNYDEYGPFWSGLALTIVCGGLVAIFIGFLLPPSFLEKFDYTAGEDLAMTREGEEMKNGENDEEETENELRRRNIEDAL